jgi:hypothetical protein
MTIQVIINLTFIKLLSNFNLIFLKGSLKIEQVCSRIFQDLGSIKCQMPLYLQECDCKRCESECGPDQLSHCLQQPGMHVHVHTQLELCAGRVQDDKQQLQFVQLGCSIQSD